MNIISFLKEEEESQGQFILHRVQIPAIHHSTNITATINNKNINLR